MKRGKKSINIGGIISAAVITIYTVFVLLDAFVIPRDIVRVEDIDVSRPESHSSLPPETSFFSEPETKEESETLPESQESSEEPFTEPHEPVYTDTYYSDENITINIDTVREHDTDIYIADIKLSAPSYLRAGLANGAFGRNVKAITSEIAKECGAVLAINGDFYGFRDRGYVMRNGYLYRDSMYSRDSEDLVVYADGSFEIVKETDILADELAEKGAEQIFSFGPGLVVNGEITVNDGEEVEQAMNSNPRTAIGEIEPLHYVFVVSDGRTDKSDGLSLAELAEVMKGLGCVNAYNLDGGGSSTMWFMGRIVNNPTSHGSSSHERSVSDIVYIG